MICSLFKGIFRTSVVTSVLAAVAIGGAVLVAGSERTKAVLHQVHGSVVEKIDQAIDDPTALRAQLEELESQYPERIAQVRGDLAELTEQIRQIERDRDIAERVVALADEDLAVLEPKVTAVAAAHAVDPLRASVAFDGKLLSYERAGAKLNQIRQTQVAYANRAADADHDLTYLRQQAGRLGELLAELETERAQFQSQIWQLSRQVDSIARNERLIALIEKRNRTLEECSRYDVASLDQITSQLAQIRTRQEAELDVLSGAQNRNVYEQTARMQLDGAPAGGGAADEAAGVPGSYASAR